MSLYEEIGAAPTASPDEIKAAHRKAAKRHHPDRGGDRAMFDKIQRAYTVLIDPDQRARYDETGVFDETPESAEEREMLTVVQRALMSVVLGKEDLARCDVIGATIAVVNRGLEEIAAKTAEAATHLERIAAARTRITRLDPAQQDSLGQLLDHQTHELKAAGPRLERAGRAHAKALELLYGYAYRVDSEGLSAVLSRAPGTLNIEIG